MTALCFPISLCPAVQNPDGSLSQAAMMQNALQKERREMKQIQREADADAIPVGINKNWIDPMPEGMTPSMNPVILSSFMETYVA